MMVRGLLLRNYRNYRSLSLDFSDDINIFLGKNAQGKTNIIESVYYSAFGRSHRTRIDNDLIFWQENQALLQISMERWDVSHEIRFEFRRGKKRNILWNENPIRRSELIGKLNAVLFSPEDLFLIKGAPAGRRRFLDRELSQANPSYYHDLLAYTHIVNQRNVLLKRIREQQAKTDMLELWDRQLAEYAVRIAEKRMEAVQKLNLLSSSMQRRISSDMEELSVSYVISGMEENMTKGMLSWYNEKIENSRAVDLARGSTSIGPHHDDLAFHVNGVDLRSFGSQGQQRTGALALKLSELEFLRSETGEYPVLLLDDVMSELDRARRQQLLDFIRQEHIQTIVTATDEAYFPQIGSDAVYDVHEGTVRKRK